MNCEQRKEQVSLFIDGELDPGEHSALLSHLGECPDCTAFFEVLLKVKEAGRAERAAYPAGLDEAILDNVAARQPRRQKQGVPGTSGKIFWNRRISLPLPLAAAVVVLIVTLALMVIRSSKRETVAEQIPGPTPVAAQEYPGQRAPVNFVYGMPEVKVYGSYSVKKN